MIFPATLRRFGLAILSLAIAPCVSTLSAEDRTFTTSPSLATEATTLVKLLELYHYNRANVRSSDYSEVIPDYMAELDGQHMFFPRDRQEGLHDQVQRSNRVLAGRLSGGHRRRL